MVTLLPWQGAVGETLLKAIVRRYLFAGVALAFGISLCASTSLSAEDAKFITGRRLMGIAFLGGSALLVKKGLDYHKDADKLYSLYKEADGPEDADRLYNRTTDRDVKSQVSWALAVAFAFSGLRMVLTRDFTMYTRQKGVGKEVFRGFFIDPRVDRYAPEVRLKKVWSFF